MKVKRVTTKSKKRKIFIIIIFFIFSICVFGVTFSYFTNLVKLEHIYSIKPFSTTVEDEISTPNYWLPGETYEKKIGIANNGEVPIAVRVSYTEKWVSAAGKTLSGYKNGIRAVLIKFSNSPNWIIKKEKGKTYYYYKKFLKPGESVKESLIESITLNKDLDDNFNCITSNNGRKVECTIDDYSYAGGTYTLTVIIETVQSDAYQIFWGTTIQLVN